MSAQPVAEQDSLNLDPVPVADTVTQIRQLARDYRALEQTKTQIEEHQAAIRQRVRALLDVGDTVDVDGRMVRVDRNRRFNPSLAEEVLPPELLALCKVAKVDAATARRVLPPSIYDSLMTDVGEPRVVLA